MPVLNSSAARPAVTAKAPPSQRAMALSACRLTLMAALALSACMALAQDNQRSVQGAPAAPSAAAATAPAPDARNGGSSWTVAQIDDAFRMTDRNADGMISREEAAIWTGLSNNFEQADANQDGTISRAEFEARMR